jgi:hypothetical protein
MALMSRFSRAMMAVGVVAVGYEVSLLFAVVAGNPASIMVGTLGIIALILSSVCVIPNRLALTRFYSCGSRQGD